MDYSNVSVRMSCLQCIAVTSRKLYYHTTFKKCSTANKSTVTVDTLQKLYNKQWILAAIIRICNVSWAQNCPLAGVSRVCVSIFAMKLQLSTPGPGTWPVHHFQLVDSSLSWCYWPHLCITSNIPVLFWCVILPSPFVFTCRFLIKSVTSIF